MNGFQLIKDNQIIQSNNLSLHFGEIADQIISALSMPVLWWLLKEKGLHCWLRIRTWRRTIDMK
jgi:hypothetical protein